LPCLTSHEIVSAEQCVEAFQNIPVVVRKYLISVFIVMLLHAEFLYKLQMTGASNDNIFWAVFLISYVVMMLY
jgi:hypothetical protein